MAKAGHRPLTHIRQFPIWDFALGNFISMPINPPAPATLVSFRFDPVQPAFSPPIQLLDGFSMDVSIEESVGETPLLWSFLLGTHWTSYGQAGLTVNDLDGSLLTNPGCILTVPTSRITGNFLRAQALSDSIPQLAVSVVWQ